MLVTLQNHGNLFERSITCTLTDTIDGNLNLTCTIQNTLQGIGSSHTEVVMTVGRKACLVNGVEIMMRRSSTRFTRSYLQLADKKKEVTDEDVLMLAGADSADKHGVQLDWLQVTTGKGVKSVASIGLDIAGQKFEAASSGNGPVDAAINALKKVITKEMNLKEFTIQAIDKGSDDVGKVHMQVEYDGHVYYGFGADTDIVTASVEAYIDCINKFKIR